MSALRLSLLASAAAIVGTIVIVSCVGDQNGKYIDSNDIPEGGARVSPDTITCGSIDAGCYAGAEGFFECCQGPGAAGGGFCTDAGAACPPATGVMICEESADCNTEPNGDPDTCCGTVDSFSPDGGVAWTTVCAATCPSPKVQFCRTNGECANGQKCVIQKCSDGFTYEFCGVFSPPGAVFTCKAQ